MISHNQGDKAKPGRMALPDIDIQLQIESNLKKLYSLHHAIIKTYHEKGHPDDTGKEICWIGKLNVVADSLAYQAEYNKKSSEVHYPAQIISICQQEEMITRDLEIIIDDTRCMPGKFSVTTYMQGTSKWLDQALQELNWEIGPRTTKKLRIVISPTTFQEHRRWSGVRQFRFSEIGELRAAPVFSKCGRRCNFLLLLQFFGKICWKYYLDMFENIISPRKLSCLQFFCAQKNLFFSHRKFQHGRKTLFFSYRLEIFHLIFFQVLAKEIYTDTFY